MAVIVLGYECSSTSGKLTDKRRRHSRPISIFRVSSEASCDTPATAVGLSRTVSHCYKFVLCWCILMLLNVKCKSDYSVQWQVTGWALYKWEKSQKEGEESETRCDLRRQQKMERVGSSDVWWKTVPQLSGCNRKYSVADSGRWVRRTSRDVDEAEHSWIL